MSILTRDEIFKSIEKGEIRIDPFHEENVGPASIDLTLGDKFRIFERSIDIVDVDNDSDYKKQSKLVTLNSLIIEPKETILGITREKITLAPNICGWLEGRSKYARLGLMVHISASFMQPGISNHQVLEISNMGSVTVRLHAGTKMCQFIFERTIGSAVYKGQFAAQDHP